MATRTGGSGTLAAEPGAPARGEVVARERTGLAVPWRAMLGVFLLAAALRAILLLVAILGPGRAEWEPDSGEYALLGRNLAFHGAFSQAEGAPFVPDRQRMPLFPGQVAIAFLIAGDRAGVAEGVAVAGNVLLGAAAAALLVPLAAAAGWPRAGVAAGLLLACDITSVVYSALLLSEPLFTALLVGATFALVRYARGPAARPAALAGGLIGLAILARPIGLLLPLVVAPAFLLARGRRWPVALRDAALCVAVAIALVAPWSARARAIGGPDPTAKQAAINGYIHRAALLESARTGRDPEDIRADLEASFAAEAARNGWGEEEQVRVMQERAANLLRDQPGEYLRLQVLGMLHLLGPETDAIFDVTGLRANQRAHAAPAIFGAVKAAGMAQLAALYLLAAAGAVLLLRARRLAILAALVLPVGYFLVAAGPEAYARFRVPLMPAIALLAGVALAALAARREEARRA